jgi:hypothetical protein
MSTRDEMSRPSNEHREFFGLSLKDLAFTRDLFHLQLLDHPNVVGTALGRYLIRVDDPWPRDEGSAQTLLAAAPRQRPPRRLDNSEVRPYSWPCVLVLVSEWIDYGAVAEGTRDPGDLLPRQLWLPDGRRVPVCVVETRPVGENRQPLGTLRFPKGLLGSGLPVVTDVQVRLGSARWAALSATARRRTP